MNMSWPEVIVIPYCRAHAARVDEFNIVREVIVIPYCNDNDADVTAYCNGIGLPGTWLDTSYLGARRGRYAGIGYTFDADADVFVAPQPYPSWSLDENYDWQPPVPYPADGVWVWDENTGAWVEP